MRIQKIQWVENLSIWSILLILAVYIVQRVLNIFKADIFVQFAHDAFLSITELLRRTRGRATGASAVAGSPIWELHPPHPSKEILTPVHEVIVLKGKTYEYIWMKLHKIFTNKNNRQAYRCYDNEVEDKKKEVFDAYERDLKWGVHSWGIPDLD